MSSTPIQPAKSKPVLFSLLTLLSGIVIGVGGTLIFVGPQEKYAPPPVPEEFSRRMVDHLTRELSLTAEQQEKIKPIVETHMKTLDKYREEARPKIRQELEDMNNEIMALLDTNQQQMWKDSIERMQQRFRESRERRGPGPGPGGDGPGDRRGRDRNWRGDQPVGDPNSPSFRKRRMPGGMMPGDRQGPPNNHPPRDSNEPGQQPGLMM